MTLAEMLQAELSKLSPSDLEGIAACATKIAGAPEKSRQPLLINDRDRRDWDLLCGLIGVEAALDVCCLMDNPRKRPRDVAAAIGVELSRIRT